MLPSDPWVLVGAIHEAGHVVMRHHHGLAVAEFTVFADGTGLVVGGGEASFDLSTKVDCLLAGPAAEGIFGSPRQAPERSQVQGILDGLETGDEDEDEDEEDDYDKAAEAIMRATTAWNADHITQFMLTSFARCTDLLQQRWQDVRKLAEVAAATPGEPIFHRQIEAVLNRDATGVEVTDEQTT